VNLAPSKRFSSALEVTFCSTESLTEGARAGGFLLKTRLWAPTTLDRRARETRKRDAREPILDNDSDLLVVSLEVENWNTIRREVESVVEKRVRNIQSGCPQGSREEMTIKERLEIFWGRGGGVAGLQAYNLLKGQSKSLCHRPFGPKNNCSKRGSNIYT